jgi:hypothetical protein
VIDIWLMEREDRAASLTIWTNDDGRHAATPVLDNRVGIQVDLPTGLLPGVFSRPLRFPLTSRQRAHETPCSDGNMP